MSFRKIKALCCFLLFPALSALSQKFNFENYSVKDGLPNNVVKSIAQDELGFMYFGTNNGLSVYDGSGFSTFDLPGQDNARQVFRMKTLESRKLWISFSGNKRVLWLRRGVLQIPAIPALADINNAYEQADGSVLFCTDGGLFRLNGSVVSSVPLSIREGSRIIHFLFPVNDSLMLVCRKGLSLALIDRRTLRTLDESAEDISVNDFQADAAGDLWMATDSHGLLKLDGRELRAGRIRFQLLPESLRFLGKEDIFCISRNKDQQTMLLGTSHYGIVVYHRNGKTDFINKTNGLSSNKVRCLFMDKDKNYWIGTDFGVDKLNNANFIFFSMRDGGAIGSTYRLQRDSSGRMWFFGNEYMYYTHGDTADALAYPPGVEKIALGTVAEPNGVWISVPNHLFYINTAGRKPVVGRVLPTADTYRKLINWDPGHIILGGRNTLALLHDGQVSTLSTDFNNIRALCIDDWHKLWVGTFSSGLFRIDVQARQGGAGLRVMQRISDSIGEYNRFLSLTCDRSGRLWAGTRFNGIYLYAVDSGWAHQLKQLSIRDGLSNNYITSMSQAANGEMWVGTGTGFDRVRENDNRMQVTRMSQYYNFNNPVNQVRVDDQYLWAATDVGAVRLQLVNDRNYIFPAYFKDLVFPDSTRHLFSSDTTLRFGASQNSFSVSFTAPFYINEQQTRYFYRLMHKKEAQWIEVKGNHSINFNSLESGKYTLLLKAVAFNGQPTSIISRLEFEIETPFLRSVAFLVLLGLLLLGMAWLVYRYRIRQLKKLFTVRDNISRNLHDEIGATLSSINIYSDVARQKIGSGHEVKPLLDRIYTGSGQVMENMNDIVWYVNPKHDSIEDILVRMREFAIPILEARNMDVSFKADDRLMHDKLTMLQRQNIYFIFKEAVNNIAKYSRATAVIIEVSRDHSTLELSIHDNGRGFDPDNCRKGNGLINMQQRASVLKAALRIGTVGGEGTLIDLKVPVG